MLVRPLCEDDIPFAMRLKEAAGWNQTAGDWRSFIALRPDGCFLAEWEGKPAGTVTTIDHGGAIGWIGMLLVAPELRGRGIGTRLLGAAIESLSACATIKLDATPAGRKIYLPMGFVDEAVIERRVRMTSVKRAVASAGATDPVSLEPLGAGDLRSIESFDARAFGCARLRVLESWLRNAPQYAFVAKAGDSMQGYCLGRHGSRCDQIGPLVAVSLSAAEALLDAALDAGADRAVLLDVFAHDAEWLRMLDRIGFTVERALTRMRRGPECSAAGAASYLAIAGLEIG